MKKVTLMALIIMLSAIWSSPGYASNTSIINGKLVQGRTLVPIRELSAVLKAKVIWNEKSKTVTITQESTAIVLTIDSKHVLLNGVDMEIDVPAQLLNNTTYVPIRYVTQVLGGTIKWETDVAVAVISVNDMQIRVLTQTDSKSNSSQIPQQTIETFVQKANEAADLSKITQVRTHFKAYVTDSFINKLVQQKGLVYKTPFTEKFYANTYGSFGSITQSSFNADRTAFAIERRIIVKFIDGKWLVDDIEFTTLYP
ncbi:copper amine oxidase N-terminal domain-containing protein [Paenibacillus sp. ATY16]|uniref:copper amine oxidase N-terminal domain-containing protein n=1 Tax=Paenibacillus sp. ATY16 TaxID=1759312 RepID=UPI00200E974D|nr:copper amine oxidase N-terminal domain-containing protein [Paenibacillus sp. ATY16]MCK9861366.1 copper amine oxidase N-terminal domain-containing protein [Paenibacillus sp. ATY16]